MTPTPEQQAIVQAFDEGKQLVIEAGAGAAKTTTLRLAAQANPRKIGVYVVYNKALANDALGTFPKNTVCKTAHSLAYASVGKKVAHRLNGPRVPMYRVARALEVPELSDLGGLKISDVDLARAAMQGLGRFYNGDAERPDASHVWNPGPLDKEELARLRELAVPIMQRAWEDVTAPSGQLRVEHDTYLKMWQLQHPRIAGDFVLLDEAQDANPCMASIFAQQQGVQRVAVGDGAQQIYAWRGAVDVMQDMEADARLTLSKSFRFGERLAAEANKWLRLLDSKMRLTGNELVESTVEEEVDKPGAILCRTNAAAMGEVLSLLHAGSKVALVGGGDALRGLAEAAMKLKAGERTSHPELFLFKDWQELKRHVEEEPGAGDLRVFVKLVEQYGPGTLIRALAQLSEEQDADVVVSTVHRSKGREWPVVRISQDFPSPGFDEEWPDGRAKPQRDVADEELRLNYVATTRAKKTLCRGGLSWVDRMLEEIGL